MNVKEIVPDTNGTISHYIATAFPFTILTIWIIIAFQSKYMFPHSSFWRRLFWPYLLVPRLFGQRRYPVRLSDELLPNGMV